MPTPKQKPLFTVAQISDSHLFSARDACHHGANVYQNLVATLADINAKAPDILIFTGDLTQDHSEASYLNFATAFNSIVGAMACYYLPGNHDEVALLDKYLIPAGFSAEKCITIKQWQLLLLNSKSATPAGSFNVNEFNQLSTMASAEQQFVFMHHHAIDVGYFIDKHGLNNQHEFWQVMDNSPAVKGIACGHVHRAMDVLSHSSGYSKALYTCPATSIAFDPTASTVKALEITPAYRLFEFYQDGSIATQVIKVGLPDE